MKRAAVILLLLFGCQEPFSNEDILFLKAVPRSLEIDVPDEADRTMRGLRPAQEMPAGSGKFYEDMVKGASDINIGIFGVLDVVEVITRQPATVRDTELDRRAWGPFQPEPDDPNEVLLVVDRVFTDETTVVQFTEESAPLEVDHFFRYGINVRRVGTSTFTTVITGETVLLEADEEEATGTLCINFDEIRKFDPDEDAKGVFCVGYDFRGDDEIIQVAVEGSAEKANLFADPDAAFVYVRRPDNSGRFQFNNKSDELTEEQGGTSAPEIFNVRVRWIPDLAGRADVEICGDDVARINQGSSFYAVECWNSAFVRTFLLSSFPDPDFEQVGTISNCAAPFRDDPIDAGPCGD